MEIQMRFVVFAIVGLGLILGGAIALQVFLSRRENKRLGLILPIIALMLSLVPTLGVSTAEDIVTHPREIILPSGDNTAVVYPPDDGSGRVTETRRAGASGATVVLVFFLSNIPTVLLIAIHLACRESFKRRRGIERMRLQDLE
jgi:hypothetical protein